MSERLDQLNRIIDDLEEYLKACCPCSEDGKFNDFSGQQCNDACLMLLEAKNALATEF